MILFELKKDTWSNLIILKYLTNELNATFTGDIHEKHLFLLSKYLK